MAGLTLRNILCPIDFSEHSRNALAWAGSLGLRTSARVNVLHAEPFAVPWEFTPNMVVEIAGALSAARDAVRGQVEAFAAKTLPAGVTFEADVVENVPVESIVEKAAALPADLVAIGSHGHGGLHRFLAGSVTEEVIRRVDCPVLVTRRRTGEASQTDPARILCTISRSTLADRLLQVAAALAAAYDASLLVTHVQDPLDASSLADADDAGRWCDAMAAQIGGECQVRKVVRSGNAAEQTIHAAREDRSDLIIVGARKRPFLDATVLGTTTERIVRHAPVSVLVVPG